MMPVDDEPLGDVQDVSRRFKVPVSWVYAKAESGELPSFKIGRYRRFRMSEIGAYLRGCQEGVRSGNGDGS